MSVQSSTTIRLKSIHDTYYTKFSIDSYQLPCCFCEFTLLTFTFSTTDSKVLKILVLLSPEFKERKDLKQHSQRCLKNANTDSGKCYLMVD